MEPLRSRSRTELWTLLLITIAGAAPFLLRVSADPDLWWHVRSGQLIWAERGVPAVDTWSFTASGEAWVNHEWLADTVMASVFDLMGQSGLLLLRDLLIVAMVVGLVLVFAERVREPLLVFVGVVAAVPITGLFMNVRPHAFSYALVVWAVVVLDRARRGRLAWLWALPFIMLLWVNLHGGFLLGLGLIGVSLGAMLIGWDGMAQRPNGKEQRTIILVGLATVAATLVTPHGFQLYRYLAGELTADHSIISEWLPSAGNDLLIWWLLLAVPLGLWVLARQWRHISLLVFFVGSALMTYRQVRFQVVMAIFAALVIVDSLPPLIEQLRRDKGEGSRFVRALEPRVALVGVGSLAGVVVAWMLVSAVVSDTGVGVDTDVYPIAATEWLMEQDTGPNVGLPLRFGGYTIWHQPDKLVSLDGRNLTIYDDEWVDRYLRALRDGRLLDVVDEDLFDVFLLAEGTPQVDALLATGRWSVAYRDPIAVVVVPGTVGSVVEGPEPPARATFP